MSHTKSHRICPCGDFHKIDEHICERSVCSKPFRYGIERHECDACPCGGNHLPWDHTCQNSLCSQVYHFGEDHECHACPCGDNHLPEDHVCLGCKKNIEYIHCCKVECECFDEQSANCAYHKSCFVFISVAHEVKLPSELVKMIIEMNVDCDESDDDCEFY